MARVLRTPLARSDLEEVGRYIAQESHSREVAIRFLEVIADRCQIYASQPLIGEACPDLGPDVRRFSVGNYVVFYIPIKGGIDLLRVLHGARDVPTVWRQKRR